MYTPAVVGYIGPIVVIIHGVDAQQRRVIDTSQAVRPYTNGQKFQKVENDENRFFAITSQNCSKIDFVKGISSAIIFFTTIAFFMFFSLH